MSTINGKACVANGVAVDKVFSDGKQVYSRNMLIESGFESGKTPSGIFWGTGNGNIKSCGVVSAVPTFPTPFGNYMLKIANQNGQSNSEQYIFIPLAKPVTIKAGETWTYSYYYASGGAATGQASDFLVASNDIIWGLSMGHDPRETSGGQTSWHRFVKTWTATNDMTVSHLRFGFVKTSASDGWICIDNIKLEKNNTISPWSPAPEDVM